MTQIVAGKNALSSKEVSKVRILAFAALVIGANVCASIASGSLLTKYEGWKQLDVPNRPAATFSFEQAGGGKHNLTVRTNKSVAFLYREVSASDS